MKKTGKKGFTLTELTVVLGLVAIISVMVVSFAVMMSHRTRLSAARLDVINEIETVENITETWLGQMKLLGATLSLEVNENTGQTRLQAAHSTVTYQLIFDEEQHVLTGTLPGGEELSFRLERVIGMEFSQVQVEDLIKTKKLFFCTLVCDLPGLTNGAGDRNFQVICFNPHVGDTYGSGGGAS